MPVTIKIDDKELKKTVAKLRGVPKEIPKATSAAINRTITFVTKRVKKEVTNEYSTKAGEVAATFKIRKANSSNLTASINSKGRLLTLSHFPANLKAGWTKGTNVKVKVKRTGYKQVNGSPQPFVTSLGGNLQIVRRKTSKSYPIEVLKTLSIPQMISNTKINENISKEASEQLQKRIEHEVEFRLNKLTK